MRKAVARDELVLHYQPIVEVASGRIVGAEALLRWRHPERGLLFPRDFIDLAEATGLITTMGPWILQDRLRPGPGLARPGLPRTSRWP